MSRPSAAHPPAESILRGVEALCAAHDWASLREFRLPTGRRLDLAALTPKGDILAIEVKSGPADFRADTKWTDYLAWCDSFYFAVGPDFPESITFTTEGLIVADQHGASIRRDAAPYRLVAARRRALTLQFARCAATRLRRRTADPGLSALGA